MKEKTVASKYDNRQPFDMAGFKFDSVNVPDRSMHSRGKTEDEQLRLNKMTANAAAAPMKVENTNDKCDIADGFCFECNFKGFFLCLLLQQHCSTYVQMNVFFLTFASE